MTSRFYGDADELLSKYAWFQENSDNRAASVGLLKPSDYGLFDILGNVWNWCQDERIDYPTSPLPIQDSPRAGPVFDDQRRVLRGSCFNLSAKIARSAYRNFDPPSNRYYVTGIRPVRTIPKS